MNLLAVAAALLLMSLLVWQSSSAAFTGSTDEPLEVATGTIDLTDDDAASVYFTTGYMLWPGDPADTACVTVTYDQSPATPVPPLTAVSVYISANSETNGLGDYLELTVSEGCGLAASPIMATDTVNNQAATYTNFATGVGTWVPAADLDTQQYEVQFELPSTTPDSAQGGTVDVTLTWEVQTS